MATNNKNCKGCDCGPSIPEPCITPPPVCPDPQPCDEVVDSQCVIYNGPAIQCNGEIILAPGTSITNALINLIEYIQNINHVVCGPAACEIAYKYLTDYSLVYATEDRTPAEIFDRLLDKGYVMPISESSICCPVCGPYVLASVETYLKFAEAVGIDSSSPSPCCANVFASVETYLKYAEAIGCTESAPVPAKSEVAPFASISPDPYTGDVCNGCDNGFTEELEELFTILPDEPDSIDRVLDKGVVEHGSLNVDLSSNISDLQAMLEAWAAVTPPPPAGSTTSEMLDRILDKGIVIQCYRGQIIIASVETYLKWAEAMGLTQSAAIPA